MVSHKHHCFLAMLSENVIILQIIYSSNKHLHLLIHERTELVWNWRICTIYVPKYL